MKSNSFEVVDSCAENLKLKRKKLLRRYRNKIFFFRFVFTIWPFFVLYKWFLSVPVAVLCLVVFTIFFDHEELYNFKDEIHIWFGVPGSGKTSMGALIVKSFIKLGYPVLSNVPIRGALRLCEGDLGRYDMSFDDGGCVVIYDEATVNGLDNRDYKAFSGDLKRYFSLHRHMTNAVNVFSQGYDVDKRVRDRASSSGLFELKRTFIPGLIMYKRIKRVMFIKKDDKQYIDGFQYKGLPRLVWSRSVWGSFDTKDKSLCPKEKKVFEPWIFSD